MSNESDAALPRPKVNLTGHDDNTAVLRACRRAAFAAGWTQAEWNEFRDLAIDCDCLFLLCEIYDHFDVE